MKSGEKNEKKRRGGPEVLDRVGQLVFLLSKAGGIFKETSQNDYYNHKTIYKDEKKEEKEATKG